MFGRLLFWRCGSTRFKGYGEMVDEVGGTGGG